MNRALRAVIIAILLSDSVFINICLADEGKNSLYAHKVTSAIKIDGMKNDTSWDLAQWYPLAYLILGEKPTEQDFKGRFKILWDEKHIYLLVEITDDILFDQYADPLHFYWDDDCLEVFIDEDASGGNHQFNFNAFAYHVALDNQVVDIGPNNSDGTTNFVLLNEHINNVWRRSHEKPNNILWELAISVFDKEFSLDRALQKTTELTLGKTLGFMLAYCDNDGSRERENFINSTDITAVNGNKNIGYITADVFQKLTLIK